MPHQYVHTLLNICCYGSTASWPLGKKELVIFSILCLTKRAALDSSPHQERKKSLFVGSLPTWLSPTVKWRYMEWLPQRFRLSRGLGYQCAAILVLHNNLSAHVCVCGGGRGRTGGRTLVCVGCIKSVCEMFTTAVFESYSIIWFVTKLI